jgi:hypothetical protein
VSDEVHRYRLHEIIGANRRYSQQTIANKSYVSHARVQAIIAKLGYRNLCARFVIQDVLANDI